MISDKAKKLLFKEESFKKIGKLPENGYSESYMCEDTKTSRKVVLKYANLMSAQACKDDGSADPAFYNKIFKLASLMHPCICPIEGYTVPTGKRVPIIISTYCKNGALNDSMIRRLSQSKKWIIAIGIASAIKYLHHENIIDLNLKLSNILLDENDQPFITDFGYQTLSKENILPSQNIGTILYKAPECITKSSPPTVKSDIYSFGIILYHLFSNKSAYNDRENPITQVFSFSRGHRPRISEEVSPVIANIIKLCWDPNPDIRPTAAAVFDLLITSIKDLVDSLDEQLIVPYLRNILDFEYGSALSAFGDARGKLNAAKVLYNATDAPNIREKCKEDIKVTAEAGDREARVFYKKITGETIGNEEELLTAEGDDDGVRIQLKREKKKHKKSALPKVTNKEIVEAAAAGNREKIRALLADNVNVNSQNDDGDTALTAAVKNGDLTLTQILLSTDGINPNIVNNKGCTALHEACKFGNTEIVQALILFKGIDLTIKDKMGYGALEWATTEELKSILVKAGAVPAVKKKPAKKSSKKTSSKTKTITNDD